MLAREARAVAADLLPRGKQDGSTWRAPSLQTKARSSVCVQLSGAKAGLWVDHANDQDRGDLLTLAAIVLYGGDLKAAIGWAKAKLGISDAAPLPPMDLPEPEEAAADIAERLRKREDAKRLWLAAEAKLAGTPVDSYLRGRGIDLARMGRQPRALRFHPSLWNSESQRHWPALVAAITGPDNGVLAHIATHRIWLAPGPQHWGKAPLEDAKRALGSFKGGWISLSRGASQKNLRDAPPGDCVAIAEGIETALSVAVACPELRVLSSVALANMKHLALPEAIGTVILCPDADASNAQAVRANDRAVAAAVQRFGDEGRTVKVARPQTPDADWNDVLTGKAAA